MIPLLMGFSKTDERKSAMKACSILRRILPVHKDVGVEVIKKMMKPDMAIPKECAAQLIVVMIPVLDNQESVLLEQYSSLLNGNNPQYRIICAKYLHEVLEKVKIKE